MASSTTTNLGLKLLGTSLADKETYFQEWRQDINGEDNDSNMNIIDRAYKELSDDIDALDEGAVKEIAYDANGKKITKTINGTTTDVVSAADLKTDMALNNVNNTSDADKPVSTATQSALDQKADKASAVATVAYDANGKKITKTINGTTTDVVSAADLAGDMEVISDAQIDALFEE